MNTTNPAEIFIFSDDEWWLPYFLQRRFDIPIVPPVQSSTLVLLNRDLLGRTVPEIRSLLRANGISYMNGLQAFELETHSVNLPARTITLTRKPQPPSPFILPDSAFILQGSGFFPFHALLMAAYCSRIAFDLPPITDEGGHSTSSITFSIRTIRLSFENEKVMGCFREWLYRQDENMLRSAILPLASTPSLPIAAPFEALQQDQERRRRLSQDLAAYFPEPRLWHYVSNVVDFRRLMTLLGVDDQRIWTALSLSWGILLDALNFSCLSRSSEDESRGIDTSGARELLRRGLGVFDVASGIPLP